MNRTVSVWNKLRQAVPDWPGIVLTSPWAHRPWILPLEAFPPSFQREVDGWLAQLGEPDLFDEDAPDEPMRPSTIAQKRMEIRMFASSLVERGREPSEIGSLTDLVTPENLRLGLSPGRRSISRRAS